MTLGKKVSSTLHVLVVYALNLEKTSSFNTVCISIDVLFNVFIRLKSNFVISARIGHVKENNVRHGSVTS